MTAYYNEIDPFAAQWLRELIKAGHIAPGDVDERSIIDIRPADLAGYTQCHFFAGIGVWSYALRRAGWSDSTPVWTGSCPCQPFSAAGKGAGFADERHLWPHFHYLIEQCQPAVVLGEQVASKDGLAWLDLVQADMEATRYAFGAVDTCSAGFGAPHIRQRLYWIGERGVGQADACGEGLERQDARALGNERAASERGGRVGGLADNELQQRSVCQAGGDVSRGWEQEPTATSGFGKPGRLADASNLRHGDRESRNARGARPSSQGGGELEGHREQPIAHASGTVRLAHDTSSRRREECQDDGWRAISASAQGLAARPFDGDSHSRPSPTNGLWRDPDWLFCRDEKWRPVEPGTFPLAHGAPARVGRLRGYGNAINAEAAIAFIEAYIGTA